MKRRAVPVWEVILTGRLDAEGKRYVNNKKIFADTFNYLIYSGKQIIKPEALHPVDTTEITIPYGNGARTTVQKYRDTLKIWSSMQDENCMYILLGAEIQNKGHYAMPVRAMLYDALNYASQVDEARNSYRKKNEEGDIVSCKGSITIKLSREEFLSGFRKEDKLIPVVTGVIYFGPDEWNASRSIHEMLSNRDKDLLRAIPDYKINLITPRDTPDADFDTKFSTGLGLVLHAIKYSRTKAVDILKATNHKKIDRVSGEFLRDALNMDLEFSEPEKEGEVDMCKAVADYTLKEKILAVIEMMKSLGYSEEDIIKNVLNQYDVTEQYVHDLMHSAA